MKIDEPKTPYEAYESEGDEPREELDAALLAARMEAEGHKGPRPRRSQIQLSQQQKYNSHIDRNTILVCRISEPSADPEDLALLSPGERDKRRSFESKRKKHYNEFQAVKMARALMDEDDDGEVSNRSLINMFLLT